MTDPTSTTASAVERQGTASSISLALSTLAIALALADVPTQLPTHSRTSGATMSVTVQDWDVGGALLSAISALHDRLLARSRALPTEAAQVLYDNLWDLYLE